MAEKTAIAWTDHTFNIAWGCQKVSPGCKFCYADDIAKVRDTRSLWGPGTPRRTFGEKHWKALYDYNAKAMAAGKNARVFCCSMCDVFENHPTITQEREKLWDYIRQTPNLDYQLLTKRHDRIEKNLPLFWNEIKHHVWLGVSVENADYVHRMDAIRDLDCAVRFVSYEPALGPIAQVANLRGIDWLIYGGESGAHFRPEDKQWARDIMAKCEESGTAFFHKQSAARYTERGIELDGKIVRNYPEPRRTKLAMLEDDTDEVPCLPEGF